MLISAYHAIFRNLPFGVGFKFFKLIFRQGFSAPKQLSRHGKAAPFLFDISPVPCYTVQAF